MSSNLSSLFQNPSNHPSTPTKKHRLTDENPTPSRLTPRRPLQNVTENDLNTRSASKNAADANQFHSLFEKPVSRKLSTSSSTVGRSPSISMQRQQHVSQSSIALNCLFQKQNNRELQLQSAFYKWLSFTLRSQLCAKNALNTPKKRRINDNPSSTQATPGRDRESFTPSATPSAMERTMKMRPGTSSKDSGLREPLSQTLADKLRQLDEKSQEEETFASLHDLHPQPMEHRYHVHVDREKLFDHGRERETPAFHANIEFHSLHKAMRDLTQSSVQTLSRIKNRQPSKENGSSSAVREISSRMDYHLGITDMTTEKQISEYIQNYGYVKPSTNPPLPLSGHGQETTSSGVALIELQHLRDKFSEWKTRYPLATNSTSKINASSEMEEK